MNEEQATELLVKIFGLQGAVDLTELESMAAGILMTSFVGWPWDLTEEQKGRAAFELYSLPGIRDMVTARCAIDSVIYKAHKYEFKMHSNMPVEVVKVSEEEMDKLQAVLDQPPVTNTGPASVMAKFKFKQGIPESE